MPTGAGGLIAMGSAGVLFAERLLAHSSRGDKTPVELFATAAEELRILFDPATDQDVRE